MSEIKGMVQIGALSYRIVKMRRGNLRGNPHLGRGLHRHLPYGPDALGAGDGHRRCRVARCRDGSDEASEDQLASPGRP